MAFMQNEIMYKLMSAKIFPYGDSLYKRMTDKNDKELTPGADKTSL